jgi:O-antigen/teichoic acid export membrane protein
MLKAILAIGGIQGIAIAIQFARTKVVAVLLGPEGVGVVSTIDQIVQFAAFAVALSLPLASVKFLSKAHSDGYEAFKQSYAGFFRLLAGIALAGTAITATLVFLRPEVLGTGVAKYQTYVVIGLLSMPAIILGGFFTNVFASAQKYRTSAALAVITNAATSLAVVVGILTAGILGVFVGGTFAGLILTLGIIIFLWKRMDLPFFSHGVHILSEIKRSPNIISFAAMLYLGSVSYSLSLLVARYAVLSNYGEAQAGLLQGAIVLSVAIGMVLNPANGLYLTPIMNRDIDKDEKMKAAVEFQRKMVMILSLVSLPVVMFPQLMLTILFSSKFTSVGHIVFLFIGAQMITQLSGVHQAFLIGVDDLKAYAVISTIGQLGFASLAWLLAPAYGIYGIAVGSVVSASAIFFATLLRLKLKHGFWPPRNLRWLIASAVSILFVAGFSSGLTAEANLQSVVAKCMFFAICIVGMFLFLDSDERSALDGLRVRFLFGR